MSKMEEKELMGEMRSLMDEAVVEAWMGLAFSHGKPINATQLRQILSLSEKYLDILPRKMVKAIEWCRDHLDRFPNQKNFNEAISKTGALNRQNDFEECKFCSNSGYIIVERDKGKYWEEILPRCFCDSGSYIDNDVPQFSKSWLANPSIRPADHMRWPDEWNLYRFFNIEKLDE